MERRASSLLVAFVLGCASSHAVVDAGSDAATRACVTHGDCDVGWQCDASRCAPSSACASDADCTAGLWCDYRHTCVTHVPSACRSRADCSAREVCVEDQCVPFADACRYDRDCRGATCIDARCVPLCGDDADCAPGDTCIDHFCTPTIECTTSADCTAGRHCVTGRCLDACAMEGASCSPRGYCEGDGFCHPEVGVMSPDCELSGDDYCLMHAHEVCTPRDCRVVCPSMTDAECVAIEASIPICALDEETGLWLCNADLPPPECRTSEDCPTERATCIDAMCR